MVAPLSFTCLVRQLNTWNSNQVETLKQTLDQHATALRNTVLIHTTNAKPQNALGDDTWKPTFRSSHSIEPQSQNEKEFANIVAQFFRISPQESSVLIRDFLNQYLSHRAPSEIEDWELTLSLDDLFHFRRQEKRAGFLSLAWIITKAEGASTINSDNRSVQGICSLWLTEQNMETDLINTIVKVVSSFWNYEEDIEWVLEIAFLYFYNNACSARNILAFINMLKSIFRARSALPPRCSLLITALFSEFLGLEIILDIDDESKRSPSEEKELVANDMLLNSLYKEDIQAIKDINNAMEEFRQEKYMSHPEAAFLLLAWGAFLTFYKKHFPEQNSSTDAKLFLSSAMKGNPFTWLSTVLTKNLKGSKNCIMKSGKRLSSVFYGFFDSFFTAFPPNNLNADQLSLLSKIISCVVSGSPELSRQIWDREAFGKTRTSGINRLLRRTAGLFPHITHPFLMLLAALSLDEDCAYAAAEFLKWEVGTFTDHFRPDAVQQVSEEQVIHSEQAQSNINFLEAGFIFQTGPFVSCLSDIKTKWGITIPANSLGFSTGEDANALVIWSIKWNAWDIICSLLDALCLAMRRPSSIDTSSNSLFLSNSYACLALMERIFQYINPEIHEKYFSDVIPWELLVDLTAAAVCSNNKNLYHLSEVIMGTMIVVFRKSRLSRKENIASSIFGRLLSAGTSLRSIFMRNISDALSMLLNLVQIAAVVFMKRSTEYFQFISFLKAEALPFWTSVLSGFGEIEKEEDKVNFWGFLEAVFYLLRLNSSLILKTRPFSDALIILLCVDKALYAPRVLVAYNDAMYAGLELTANALAESVELDGSVDGPGAASRSSLNCLESLFTENETAVTALLKLALGSFENRNNKLMETSFPNLEQDMDFSKSLIRDSSYKSDVEYVDNSQLKAKELANTCLSLLCMSLSKCSSEEKSYLSKIPQLPCFIHERDLKFFQKNGTDLIKNQNDTYLVRMMASSIEYGQRLLSRSLFVAFSDPSSNEKENKPESELGTDKLNPSRKKGELSVFNVVLQALRKHVSDMSQGLSFDAHFINSCFKLLHVAWDEYSNLWLQAWWMEENIWKVCVEFVFESNALKLLQEKKSKEDSDLDYDFSSVESEIFFALSHCLYMLAAELLKIKNTRMSNNNFSKKGLVSLMRETVSSILTDEWIEEFLSDNVIRDFGSFDKMVQATADEFKQVFGCHLFQRNQDLTLPNMNGQRHYYFNLVSQYSVLHSNMLSALMNIIRSGNLEASRREVLSSFSTFAVIFDIENSSTNLIMFQRSIALLGRGLEGIYGASASKSLSMITLISSDKLLHTRQNLDSLENDKVFVISTMLEHSTQALYGIRSLLISTSSNYCREQYDSLNEICGRFISLSMSRLGYASVKVRRNREFLLALLSLLDVGGVLKMPTLCQAVLTAIAALSFEVLEDLESAIDTLLFVAGELFNLLCSSSSDEQIKKDTILAKRALLTVLSRVVMIPKALNYLVSKGMLRYCGSLMSLYSAEMNCYDAQSRERTDSHSLWCGLLNFAATLVQESCLKNHDVEKEIIDFAAAHMDFVLARSFDLSGDWALRPFENAGMPKRVLTLARIEESHAATRLAWAVAQYGASMKNIIPDMLEKLVQAQLSFMYQAYRLIRAEPIERWIKPFSWEEKQMSMGREKSKEKSNQNEASPRAGKAKHHIPPSPGMPATPNIQTPMQMASPFPVPGGSMLTLSSASPTKRSTPSNYYYHYIPPKETISSFGEIALQILLESLLSALCMIRKITFLCNFGLFEPSMSVSSTQPTIGWLVAFQMHVCQELHRGVDDDRRRVLNAIAENSTQLIIMHFFQFQYLATTNNSFREELKKKLHVIVERMRRTVPPPSASSILTTRYIDDFINQLK